MKRAVHPSILAIVLFLTIALGAKAQSSELQLLMSKKMGFALGSQIQGQFTLSVVGPTNLASVSYQLDGREIGTVSQPPFQYSLNTDNYALGLHHISAIARTAAGQTLNSNVIDAEIVSAASGLQSTGRVVLPILGVILAVILLSVAVQFLPFGRARRPIPGVAINYGAAGGAICPRCGRPFARSIFSPNLIGGKLERCPHCGKWSITRPVSMEALRAAEATEAERDAPVLHEPTAEERLRQQIEESRISR